MGITLEDIRDNAIDTEYIIYVYDNELEENIYSGSLEDIPEQLLNEDVLSWEINRGMLGFSIH